MEIKVVVIKNVDTQMYDVVTTNPTVSVIYEVICSCKTYENAEWIVEMIEKEKL